MCTIFCLDIVMTIVRVAIRVLTVILMMYAVSADGMDGQLILTIILGCLMTIMCELVIVFTGE